MNQILLKHISTVFLCGVALASSAMTQSTAWDQGPFGGRGGNAFRENVPFGQRIVRVYGYAGTALSGLGFASADEYGNRTYSRFFGGRAGAYFNFEIPRGDFLSEVSVRPDGFVRRLTLRTAAGRVLSVGSGASATHRMKGPSLVGAVEIVGFHGRSGALVDSLGVTMRWVDGCHPTRGGNGGNPFTLVAPAGAHLVKVYGRSGAFLDSLGIVYREKGGRLVDSGLKGGSGGSNWAIALQPGDPIERVRVWVDPMGGTTMNNALVRGLEFRTKSGLEKKVGHRIGEKWDMGRSGEVIGFFGGAGALIDRLGVQARDRGRVGGYGGYGGRAFTGSFPKGARLVEVYGRAGSLIDGIGYAYEDRNGNRIDAGYHGGNGGSRWSFKIPADDYLASIQVRSDTVVRQLILRTKSGRTKTVGSATGTLRKPMAIPGRDIVVIAGASGWYLDRIHVYVRSRIEPIGRSCLGAGRTTLLAGDTPRIGHPLHVYGYHPPANSNGAVYLSPLPSVPHPMGPDCFVWLDLSRLAFAGWVKRDLFQPMWHLTWNIPAHTAFLGTTFATQAVFFTPGGFELTNGYHVTPTR